MFVSVSILLRWRLSDPSGYIGALMGEALQRTEPPGESGRSGGRLGSPNF